MSGDWETQKTVLLSGRTEQEFERTVKELRKVFFDKSIHKFHVILRKPKKTTK